MPTLPEDAKNLVELLLRPFAFTKPSSGKIQRSAYRRMLAAGRLETLLEWQAPPVR